MDFIGTVCSNQLFIYEQNEEINSYLSGRTTYHHRARRTGAEPMNKATEQDWEVSYESAYQQNRK